MDKEYCQLKTRMSRAELNRLKVGYSKQMEFSTYAPSWMAVFFMMAFLTASPYFRFGYTLFETILQLS